MKLPIENPNYDKFPVINVEGFDDDAFAGYDEIINKIKGKAFSIGRRKTIVALDCYAGVLEKEVLPPFVKGLKPSLTVQSKEVCITEEDELNLIRGNLTEDRVRGVMSCHNMEDFFDEDKLQTQRQIIDQITEGIILLYGVGASLIAEPDILIYADMARWEIQLRYRRGEAANWLSSNYNEDFLRMYKRGFFVDWRVIDRHKISLFEEIDFLLDTNEKSCPRMVTGNAFRSGLETAVKTPFRTVPYFDEGPWGGQWMKEICDLNRDKENYAWCFDGVPEENSLFLQYGDVRLEIPSINIVFYKPTELLGEKVYARFGTEFPIRFDFLDTMKGGNLSLQVHPTTEYIQKHFGMHYTQDESYYILDAGEDAVVYLGTKTGVNKEDMLDDLNNAQEGKKLFDAEKYINIIPARKHDHFLIPAGTIHCSGKNCMVLEISATPYIFTFKLWDWGRLGLDSLPRPIHIEHGKNVINWDIDTEEVLKRHVNRIEELSNVDGHIEERTGLHEREFIETRRHWSSSSMMLNTNGGVNVLNLIEGEEALVESPENSFPPYIIHYAETFIVPAGVGTYSIRPSGHSKGKKIGVIQAFVRT